ncbi:MAG: cation:proton antiporter [Candidatus Aenigmarchaeota archaeon]|nr:cation:proton antiporter [Candidatus Aenigmarchaeota archaeon]
MTVEILFSVAILLIFAKIFGEIAERLKVPSLVGEMTGGFIAGPLLNFVSPSPLLGEMANLGMLFAIFLIGLNIDVEKTKGNTKQGISLGIAGAVVPFILGFAAGYYFYDFKAAVVIGIAFMSTSSGISSRAMSSLGELNSKAGKLITSAVLYGDMISIIGLSTFIGYFSFSEAWKSATVFFILSLSIIVIAAALSKRIGQFFGFLEEMNDDQFIVAAALVAVFLLSYATQQAGIAAVSGAFVAGLLLGKSPLTESVIEPKIRTVSNGFFVPLFFAYVALSAGTGVQAQHFVPLFLLMTAAKFIGSGILTRHYGFGGRDQLTVGIAMMPRGEISIIAAYVAMTASLIGPAVFTLVVLLSIASIVLTSLLFQVFVKRW